jgi:hypothetical protein
MNFIGGTEMDLFGGSSWQRLGGSLSSFRRFAASASASAGAAAASHGLAGADCSYVSAESSAASQTPEQVRGCSEVSLFCADLHTVPLESFALS